jgi:methionyl-tRNA formyltransferase
VVVTHPDEPKGRGLKIERAPLSRWAETHGISCLQPQKLSDRDFLDTFRLLKPDAGVLVSFGKILPRPALEVPQFGIVNVHFSLLPKCRGPAPIQWAILNKESITGVSLFLIDEQIDTGDILAQQEISIAPGEYFCTLRDRLVQVSIPLLMETLTKLERGEVKPVPQRSNGATIARRLIKEDGLIDWKAPAEDICCKVRALEEWPGAWTFFRGYRLRLWRVLPWRRVRAHAEAPGQIVEIVKDNGFVVVCGSGALVVQDVQEEGRRRMSASEYLQGAHMSIGSYLRRPS